MAPGSTDIHFHTPPPRPSQASSERHSHLNVLLGGVLFVAMGFVFAGTGAPGIMVLFPFAAGFLMIGYSFVHKRTVEERALEEERAASEARERLRDEIAESVKERLKGDVKVRCRYCGALNDEHDDKCESCGAPL